MSEDIIWRCFIGLGVVRLGGAWQGILGLGLTKPHQNLPETRHPQTRREKLAGNQNPTTILLAVP